MLNTVPRLNRPTVARTIYDPCFPDLEQRRIALAGLAIFNDVITREASRLDLPLIDLRLIANEDADFANPIEPSVNGGEKIARAIARLVGDPGPTGSR